MGPQCILHARSNTVNTRHRYSTKLRGEGWETSQMAGGHIHENKRTRAVILHQFSDVTPVHFRSSFARKSRELSGTVSNYRSIWDQCTNTGQLTRHTLPGGARHVRHQQTRPVPSSCKESTAALLQQRGCVESRA
jgi:hypothetical protein